MCPECRDVLISNRGGATAVSQVVLNPDPLQPFPLWRRVWVCDCISIGTHPSSMFHGFMWGDVFSPHLRWTDSSDHYWVCRTRTPSTEVRPTFSHTYVHNSFCYVLHIEITMACETLHLVSSQIPAQFSVLLIVLTFLYCKQRNAGLKWDHVYHHTVASCVVWQEWPPLLSH